MVDELVLLATKLFDFLEKTIDFLKWVIFKLEEIIKWIINHPDDLISFINQIRLLVAQLPIIQILLGVIIILISASLIEGENKNLRVFSLAGAGIGGCYCYLVWFNKLDTLLDLTIFDILGCFLGTVFGIIAAIIIINIQNSKES